MNTLAIKLALAGFALICFMSPAAAQNVGGVFGPEVTPDSKAVEFRVAAAPASDGRPSLITSRLHYQQTVTDDLRLRVVVQGADTITSNFDFDLVQFEAQYQFLEDEEAGIDSALRFDLLLNEDGPNLVSFNNTTDIPLGEKWSLRGVVLAQVQFGDQRTDGLFLQTRASLSYKLTKSVQLQTQIFNFWGTTADFPDINDQSHSIGPAIAAKLGHGWSLEASTLFGVTDAASDADFRLFLVKSF